MKREQQLSARAETTSARPLPQHSLGPAGSRLLSSQSNNTINVHTHNNAHNNLWGILITNRSARTLKRAFLTVTRQIIFCALWSISRSVQKEVAIQPSNNDDVFVLLLSDRINPLTLALTALLMFSACRPQEPERSASPAPTNQFAAPAPPERAIATNDSVEPTSSTVITAAIENPLPSKAPPTNPVAAPAALQAEPNYPGQDIYERGLAVLRARETPRAAEKALALFQEAADAGNPPAQHALGVCYLLGIGVEKSLEDALSWLNKSAAQGYAEAQFKLASLYIRGDTVPADDSKALAFARAAADQGHADAQYNLAILFVTGRGVPKDQAEAAKWFRKAAEARHATAQSNLGVLYASGGVLEKNMDEALKWWRKAAEQGQPSAQFNLAQALLEGQSVPKDLVEAYKWFHLAGENGDRDARRLRDNLGVELSPTEVADALKRARDFKSQLHAQRQAKLEELF